MKHNSQAPLEQQLDALYQQRKQNQPLPKPVSEYIHQAALKQHQTSKKSAWLRPPLWASTFTACFVVVICVYMMPLSPSLDDNAYPANQGSNIEIYEPSASANRYASDHTETLQHQPQVEMAQQSHAGNPVANTQSLDISASGALKATPRENAMASAMVDTTRDEMTEALASKNVQAQYHGMTAQPHQAVDENAMQRAKGRTPKQAKKLHQAKRFLAVAPSAKKTHVKHQKLYRVQLTLNNGSLEDITAIDCNKQTVSIASVWLAQIDLLQQGDWLLVEFDHNQQMIKVEKSTKTLTPTCLPPP